MSIEHVGQVGKAMYNYGKSMTLHRNSMNIHRNSWENNEIMIKIDGFLCKSKVWLNEKVLINE